MTDAAVAPEPGELALVLTTAPDAETAAALARALVEERLIACGNLLPGLRSVFRWQGAVQEEAEVLLLMKTARPNVERVFRRVAELHPYEVPELVMLSADAVSDAYCRWVRRESTEVDA